ncbi:hypothetical protein I0Q12_19290 [Rhodococcus sp. CX]|uniref:hypothetical protein n=1 Tax=Rhodococcus sp. CX TaxID=2789880 RepID=UPI0018CFB3A6|nr:hypothetical protein [Rhodococcus sp. CX]MBH0121537.1 hypothetical protein [Rhodococcus sp. CX]
MTHTPESLRAAADFLNTIHYKASATALRAEAERLEREQADEKIIDAAMAAFVDAYGDIAYMADCDDRSVREGLSAVYKLILAKLDEGKAEPKRSNGGSNGGWPTASGSAESVSIVLGGTE